MVTRIRNNLAFWINGLSGGAGDPVAFIKAAGLARLREDLGRAGQLLIELELTRAELVATRAGLCRRALGLDR